MARRERVGGGRRWPSEVFGGCRGWFACLVDTVIGETDPDGVEGVGGPGTMVEAGSRELRQGLGGG